MGEWVGILDCPVHWPFKGLNEMSKLHPPPPTESNFASNNRHLKPNILIRMVFQDTAFLILRWEMKSNRIAWASACRMCFRMHMFKMSSRIPDIFWFCWIYIASVGVIIPYRRQRRILYSILCDLLFHPGVKRHGRDADHRQVLRLILFTLKTYLQFPIWWIKHRTTFP